MLDTDVMSHREQVLFWAAMMRSASFRMRRICVLALLDLCRTENV